MPIRFKYDSAAVVPPSNQTTRRFGQSLVMQQQQQKYASQQAGYDRLFRAGSQLQQQNFMSDRDMQEQRAQDFDVARARLDTYARDMLANGEVTDPEARRKIQGLIAGKTAVMGSGFDQTARQEYLDQYNAQLAGILSGVPVKSKPTRDDELKGFLGSNYDKYKDQPWVPDGKGGFTIADIPQPKESPQPQQPKTFGEYYQMEPEKARKALDDKMSEIRDSISIGEGSIAPYKSVQDKALAELEKPFEIMQDKFGQPTQAPSAAATAPATGASMVPGGSQGSNQWADVIGSDPGGGMNVPDANARTPGLPQWRVAPGTTEDIAAQDARTQATLDSTNAQLAENQARAAEIKAGYAPRTEAVRRDANVLEGRNARAESALRGELGPRAPEADPSGPYYRNAQGKPNDNRVNSTYSISGAQAEREAEQFAKNKAEFDKFKTQRAANDAKLTGRATNRIVDPEQLKRDSQKFSADYQIYKRGGGTLSTRDYIMQRAAEGTLSDDLTRQLQENYGMDLTSKGIQGVVEQDINAPREQAMSDAKAKRDAEENRKRRARGLPPIQQKAPAAPVPVDTTRPKRGLPGGPPTRPVIESAEQQELAKRLQDGMDGKIGADAYDAAWKEWSGKYGNKAEADKLFAKARKIREAKGPGTEEEASLLGQGWMAMRGPVDPYGDMANSPPATPPIAGSVPETSPPRKQPADIPILAPDPGRPPSPKQRQQSVATPEPNFRDLEASAQDDTDKTIVRKMSEVYKQNQSPEVRSAIGALFADDPVQAAKAADYLQSVGIDLEQLTAEAQYKGTGRGQTKTSPANNSSAKYGVGRGGVRTK